MTDRELPKVKSADDMDAETFLKHFNARHMPLGGLKKMGKSNIPGDDNEDLLRTYHRKVHEFGSDHKGNHEVPCNHTHGRSKK